MDIMESIKNLLPEYETVLPFSGDKITFTPFKVKDAKALATILQENNKKLALNAMTSLLKNCTKNASIDKLCLADAEYLFLQIRSKSVDEVLNLIYKEEKFQVNISDIKTRNTICEESISIGNDIVLVLTTPTLQKLNALSSLSKEELYKACIEKIILKNEIYKPNKFLTEEIQTLIDNLPLNTITKLEEFFKKQPELYLIFKKNEDQKEVSGLLNFFTFR